MPGDVVRDIGSNGCWLILWQAHTIAPYGQLASACLEPLVAGLRRHEGGPTEETATILVSSPGAVVPAHVDKEHSVLLQIEGTKEVTVGRHAARATYHRQVERRFAPVSLNLDVLPEQTRTFVLRPGDALYIPAFAVHWVRAGDEPSVSFSCGVSTRETARRVAVYEYNARLRRLGFEPHGPGAHRAVDTGKVAALGTWRWARPRLRAGGAALGGTRARVQAALTPRRRAGPGGGAQGA
jgi:quercetin dioxygenase-like cupin family protein